MHECTIKDSSVIDSRHIELPPTLTIRRRRQCDICGKRFNTHELGENDLKKFVKEIMNLKLALKASQDYVKKMKVITH